MWGETYSQVFVKTLYGNQVYAGPLRLGATGRRTLRKSNTGQIRACFFKGSGLKSLGLATGRNSQRPQVSSSVGLVVAWESLEHGRTSMKRFLRYSGKSRTEKR